MDAMRSYELEGMILQVPLSYDQQSGKYIEDYRQWIENQKFTPGGHPILFAGEDACFLAQEAAPGGCPDCGSCKFYRRAAEHTWIGICTNQDVICPNLQEPDINYEGGQPK